MKRGMSSRGPLAVKVADRVHSAAIRLLRRLRLEDRAMGLGPAQASALSVLVFGGPMSLGQLAQVEQVRPPTMSRVVASLARAGLVRREPDPHDRRRVVLMPSARGGRLMQAGRRRRLRLLASALRRLPTGELRELGRAAEALVRLAGEL